MSTTYFILNKCGEAAWVILVNFLSEKGSKGRLFVPDRLENHSNERKAKEKNKERGGRKKREEKKQWLRSWFLHWSLSFETPPFRGHSICSGKNVQTIFVLVTSIEGACTSLGGKGHFFWVSKPGFNLPSGNTLVLKKRLTTKRVDKFHSSLVKMASEFYRMSYLTKIDVLNLREFNAQHHRHNYVIIFFHFLAAWSNDCSTLWGTIKEKCIICWLIICKLQLNLHSGDTCLGCEGVPLIKDV